MNERGAIFKVGHKNQEQLRTLQADAARVGKMVCQCLRCEGFFMTPTPCDRCPDCGSSHGVAGQRRFGAESSEIRYNGEGAMP